jgi:putative transposase
MQLTERIVLTSRPDLVDLCTKTKELHNQVLYYVKHAYFGEIEKFSEFELNNIMGQYNEEKFRAMPCSVSQQVIRYVFAEMRGFWELCKIYKTDPSKLSGKPKLPRYKKVLSPAYFTSLKCRIKDDGYVHFVNNIIAPIKTRLTKDVKLKQVRIIPQATCFVAEIVYDVEETDKGLNPDNFLSVDLGINNLATCVSNVDKPFIANGKVIKSFNVWYNKTKAKLQSYVGDKGMSNKIRQLNHFRRCWMDDKLHKTSRFIVNYCVDHDIGKIVIGKNVGWKQEPNLGKVNNQKFTHIPHAKLIEKIQYKAKLVGIEVLITEESYTSKCDNLALEPMEKQEAYLGKRKKRGLFQSSTGTLLNADVNGAIGIARKVFGNSVVERIVNSGVALTPYRVNVL